METFEIKKGTSFETANGTLLVVKDCSDCVTFIEYSYNMDTSEYDILLDDNRILSTEEIKNELNRSYGKNYKVKLIEKEF